MGGFLNDKLKCVDVISEPEFIKVESVSPQLSSCQIKVCYVGKNRNGSYMSKSTLINMAQTLPGVPIIGEYIEKKEDYGDHGNKIIIDGEGIKFEKTTKPYGFVPLGAKIWFQKFNDTDEFGNVQEHEYLMTEGILWTTLYEECKKALDFVGQSMELNGDTLEGYWSEDTQSGMNFYIITDATFNALCMLGSDVEPAFEGAAITDHFTKNGEFFSQLFELRKEISRFQINKQIEKGDNAVEKELKELQDKYSLLEKDYNELKAKYEKAQADAEDAKKKKEEEEKKEKAENSKKKEEEAEAYAKVVAENQDLTAKVETYEARIAELEAYQAAEESAKKDALIASFEMLTADEKKDIIENKDNYSLSEIKSQLAVVYFDKIQAEKEQNSKINKAKDTDQIATYNLKSNEGSDELSSLAQALIAKRANKQ